jgi:hypothetical protein
LSRQLKEKKLTFVEAAASFISQSLRDAVGPVRLLFYKPCGRNSQAKAAIYYIFTFKYKVGVA